MQYLGSKRRIAKKLLEIMLPERDNRVWVEPFVGGCNMIDKVTGPRIGNDSHRYLIALLKAVQSGWIPPENVSEKMHKEVRLIPELFEDCLVGFVGFLCSFGGIWHGSYAHDASGSNYAKQGKNALLKQAPLLENVCFSHGDYKDTPLPSDSFIYCDPPYAGTAKYKDTCFNHEEFWDWCRNLKTSGHVVFISEYSAPKDFKCVLEVELTVPVNNTKANKNRNPKRIEKLFTL